MARLQWSDLRRTLPFMILLVGIFVVCLFLAALKASPVPFHELLELGSSDLGHLPFFIVLFGFIFLSLCLTCLSLRSDPSKLDSRTILLVYEQDKPKQRDVNGVDVAMEPQECVICLSHFQDKETIRLLPGCSHCFHSVCLETWLVNSRFACPLCRKPIEQMLPQQRTTAYHNAVLPPQQSTMEQGLLSMQSELHINVLY